DDHDQSEDRLHEHEDDRADGEHDRGRQEEGQSEGEEAPQHGQIVDRAREQLAGLPGVVARHRGVLQSVEQARAPGDLPARDHGATTKPRAHIPTASAMPMTSTPSTGHHRADRSRWAIGPSMMYPVIIGTTSWMPLARRVRTSTRMYTPMRERRSGQNRRRGRTDI